MDLKMELREKSHIFSPWNIRAGDVDNTLPINSDEELFIYQAINVEKEFYKLLTGIYLLVSNNGFL
jgi:hypothetical protein